MTTYTALRGQSVRDVCLITYGSLDYMVKLCVDNDITDINNIDLSGVEFTYDESLVVSQTVAQSINGFYGTAFTDLCSTVTELAITDITHDGFTISWEGAAPSYRYFVTTTPDEPTGGGSVTAATSLSVSGLDENTTYYVWVKAICATGNESGFANESTETEGMPSPPITDDLVGSYFSDYGVSLDGVEDVVQWDDLSGNDNHLLMTAVAPVLSDNRFGDKPGVVFSDVSTELKTSGAFTGLTSEQTCTVFIVTKYPTPITSYRMVMYSNAGTVAEMGAFGMFYETVSGDRVATLVRGDAGFDGGYMPLVGGTAAVITSVMDYSEAAADELDMYKNGSDASFVLTGSSENTGTFSAQTLGVGGGFQSIGCVLIYKARLTALEIDAVIDYLTVRYSI